MGQAVYEQREITCCHLCRCLAEWSHGFTSLSRCRPGKCGREKLRVSGAGNKVIFSDQFLEFCGGEAVIPPDRKVHKEEGSPLPIVQIKRTGCGFVRHNEQKQN